MPNLNFYACRESLSLFSQRTAFFNSASVGSNTVTFMKPSTFFGLYFRRSFSLKSYFNTRECLNSCTKCIRQLTLNKNVLKFLFAKQIHSIAAQRIRRCSQIFVLYRNLGYDRSHFQSLIEKFLSVYKNRSKNTWCFLFGSSIFAWNEDKVSDSEIERASVELDVVKDSKNVLNKDWELMVSKNGVQIYRKSIPSGLYRYRVYGTYKDITARAFFHTQVDLEFRKKWDKHVISLDVIDKDDLSDTEVIHWITEFPYPMSSREYVYVRRYRTDNDKMVIINRGISHHPCVPQTNEHVRVTDYSSEMVIKPHTNFDENGFDYTLTYYDDPKSSIPKVAFSWAASSGIPDFVDKLYDAAVMLQYGKKTPPSEVCCKNVSIENMESNNETKLPM